MRKSVVKNIWEIKKIKEIGRVVTGKTPPTRVKKYFGNEYPFITPTDIADNSRYVIMPARYLSKEGYEYQGSLALPKNTVCFTCIGSTIGKMAITNKVSFTNQQINSIIVDSNIADYRYIFYLLKTQVERIKNYAGGAAKPIVNKSIFKEISISCPPLPIQQKIALILSVYDDLIELNERRIKILEEMTRLIYKEWFVKFRFPGHEKVKFVDSELGKIPERWKVLQLGEVFDVKYGKNLPLKKVKKIGTYPVYGAGGIIGFYDETIEQGKVTLITCRGNGSGTVWRTRQAAFITNNSFRIKPKFSFIDYFYTELLLKNSDIARALGGSAQPQITIESISYVPVLIPQKEVIEEFIDLLQDIPELVDYLYEKNKNLRQTQNMLLPKLFFGEIDVSDLNIKLASEKI